MHRHDVYTVALLLAIFALGLWLRIQYIAVFGGLEEYLPWALKNYFGGISPTYLKLASNLLDKSEYSSLSYPPGYPLFLAFLGLVGGMEVSWIRLAQVSIDSTGVLALFWLVRAATSSRHLGLLGALFYAVHPVWAAGSTFILAESLSPVLMLWCLVSLVWAARDSKIGRWGIAGLTIGLSALVRPDFLLLIGVAAAWALLVGRSAGRWYAMVALVVGYSLPIGGWGLHNRVKHDVWLFSTTSGGVGLWEGLGAVPNEYGYVLSDVYASEMLQAKGLPWHSLEADKYLKQEYLKAWRVHPEHVIKVILFRWKKILFTSERLSPLQLSPLQSVLDRYGFWFALLALVLRWRNYTAVLIIATPIVYALLSIGLVHWEPRYVRYVHIGYVSALLVLVSCFLSHSTIRSRAAVLGVGRVLTLSGAVLLAFPGIVNAVERRKLAELSVGLPNELERGNLIEGPALGALDWIAMGGASFEISEQGLAVATTPGSFAYQVAAEMPTVSVSAILVRYSVNVDVGGASVGILDDKGSWIAVQNFSVPGMHDEVLTVGVDSSRHVTLILANNNPDGASRFTLRDLRIHFKGR